MRWRRAVGAVGQADLDPAGPQAIWRRGGHPLWKKPDAIYHRSDKGGGSWQIFHLPASWQIHYDDLTFQVKPMNFKHTGLFPEQAANWDFIRQMVASRVAYQPCNVLNLFAYTWGGNLGRCRRWRICLPCRCLQRHGGLGQGKRQAFRFGRSAHPLHCG